jgi:glucose-1-phosphate thymidylyltransferase
VHVADGVTLEDAEIGPNVTVSPGATVRGSRLRDTIVGAGATVDGSDLHDSLIGAQARVRGVRGRVDVGDHSVVEAGAPAEV